MFAQAWGDLPELIGKESYLLDSPVHIDRMVYSCQNPSREGISTLHEHPFIEISYVEKGTGTYTVWNTSHPIGQGDLFILNASVPHTLYSSSETDALIVRSLFFDPTDVFSGEIIEIGNTQYVYGLFNTNNFIVSIPLKAKSLRLISQYFDEISLETEEKKLDWKYVVSFKLALLLLQLKRLTATCLPANTTSHPGSMENTVLASEILHLIKMHYGNPLFSMKSISEILHSSTSSLSRSFHEVTGKYFSDYLCLYRIRQALPMIVDTDTSIERIASLCGYNDMHSFYRQFKQVMGTTPKELRKPDQPIQMYRINKDLNHILYTEIIENLQHGKRKEVSALVLQALEEGFPPEEILQDGLVKGISSLGDKFQTNEVFVGEVLGAAYAMNKSLDILKPYMPASQNPAKGSVLLCTVKGDMHNIGKNMVKLMMEVEGIHCIDLGEDVPAFKVVDAVREHHVKVVCLSAALTTTMREQENTINALVTAGLRNRVKVMIGGAPVTQEFAERIGADIYTPDAVTAAREAKHLLAEMENN